LEQDRAAEALERLKQLVVPTDNMHAAAAYHEVLGVRIPGRISIATHAISSSALDATLSWALHTPQWTIAARSALARAETRLGHLEPPKPS
jgi:hypothetical protein